MGIQIQIVQYSGRWKEKVQYRYTLYDKLKIMKRNRYGAMFASQGCTRKFRYEDCIAGVFNQY